jgi:ribosomal protein S18 acetylase RimI-like enzyme
MSIQARLEKFHASGGSIREINSQSLEEVDLVAGRMRQTLMDVLGEEKGGAMYSMEWLKERLLWHLDPKKTVAKLFLSLNRAQHITGHAIARIEQGGDGAAFGYFSTIFVESESRRQGIANALLLQVENWFIEKKMPKIIYNTAEGNSKLIDLFQEHGYAITAKESEMVQLTKPLP